MSASQNSQVSAFGRCILLEISGSQPDRNYILPRLSQPAVSIEGAYTVHVGVLRSNTLTPGHVVVWG